ncbi:DUF3775 domain-containing protein [Vibrio sp. Vb2960]|uniref:DUF3775 domain-containing protein n=1 Tax=Vibrio sp. Vb2960 TaxID=3074693 RepID=UPI002964CBFB|nr:DUF3775 domain-containing protein [Vibrio sp. Vb2960]EJE4697089.1 DUF3775 domain-containing protein [Vibrio parahaemolyticus]MDW1602883.1 DUF3775 domain-containing protein [Vibrio sp. Vb2960]
MNNLSIETVHEIIEMAQDCYPTTGRPQVVSLSDAVDAAMEELPGTSELYEKIASLSSEQLAELQALMLIGRGASEESADDWDNLYTEALASQHAESVDYIASKYPLPSYLQNGLAKLGR